MTLEEILPYVRKGHRATYNGEECLSLHHTLYTLGTDGKILSDKWGYLPKYTSFAEAMEALIALKVIIADAVEFNGRIERKRFSINAARNGILSQDKDGIWQYYLSAIPINWLSKNNFEIVEE